MPTTTKKELMDRIADKTNHNGVAVKPIIQEFLDSIVSELARDNRIEFRDFGIFEPKIKKARKTQNPKTLEPVQVPARRTVKFKMGRRMKQKLNGQV